VSDGAIVGWHRGDTGTQHCLACLPHKPEDGYPIIFGHPDWGYGSVPVCNAAMAEAERKARETKDSKALAKVSKPTVTIIRRDRTEYAKATARCSRCLHHAAVEVEVGSTWNGKLTRIDASKKALALAKAQIGRHLRRRWGCGR
jgi:hypothetical protein